MDLYFSDQTTILVFFDILLLLIVYLSCRSVLKYPHYLNSLKRKWIIVTLFVFSLFSFYNTDWFHYQSLYEPMKKDLFTHVEPVFYFIAQNLSFDYISFRMIVWGGGLLIVILSIKKLPLNYGLTLFLFALISLPKYSYSRVSLSMALIFMGMIVYQKAKFLYKILGGLILGCSFFFHKSAIFGIMVAVLVIISSNMNKRTMFILFSIFVMAIVFIMSNEMNTFLSMDVDNDAGGLEQSFASGQKHMVKEDGFRGIGGLIQLYSERLTYCMGAFLSYQCISKQWDAIPNDMLAIMKMQLVIVVISMLFLIDVGVNLSVIHIRFLRFSIIPTSLILSYVYENRIYPKITSFSVSVGFFASTYTVCYSFYNTFF